MKAPHLTVKCNNINTLFIQTTHKGVQTIFSSFLFVLILRACPLIIYSPPFINDAEIIQINIRLYKSHVH